MSVQDTEAINRMLFVVLEEDPKNQPNEHLWFHSCLHSYQDI